MSFTPNPPVVCNTSSRMEVARDMWEASLAAWAVVNASSSEVIRGGHLATELNFRRSSKQFLGLPPISALLKSGVTPKTQYRLLPHCSRAIIAASAARRTTVTSWKLLRNKFSTQSHGSLQYTGYLHTWISYSAQMSLRSGFALATTLQTALPFLSMRAESLSASCKGRRSGTTVGRMQLGQCSRFILQLPIQFSTQARRACPNCKEARTTA